MCKFFVEKDVCWKNKTKGLKLHRHHLSISSTKIIFFHELQIYLGITIRSILISNFIYWSITIRSIYLSITICSNSLSIYHHSLHLSIYISQFAPSIYLSIYHHLLHLSIYLSPFAPSISLTSISWNLASAAYLRLQQLTLSTIRWLWTQSADFELHQQK